MTNLRVGVQVLKECIARAGSLEAGLRYYVGAGNQAEDSGYASKVLSEQSALRLVASGKTVSPRIAPAPAPAPAAPQKSETIEPDASAVAPGRGADQIALR